MSVLHKDIELRKSSIEGKGLFAKKLIPKDTIVWELNSSEKRLTLKQLSALPWEERKLAYQQGNKYIIVTDGSEFINHSCDPNLWWETDESFSARRDIKPDEEITYDYSSSDINPKSMPPIECRCGSKNCRKIITSQDCLKPEFQNQYKGHLPSWVEKYIQRKQKENKI